MNTANFFACILGGMLCRPLITRLQSGDKFSIASIEGSSHHRTSVLGNNQAIAFKDIHHCVQVTDGHIDFAIEGSMARLAAGETLFIPSGTVFSFRFASKLAQAYIFSNGGGLVELMIKLGKEYAPPLIPEKEMDWDSSGLSRFENELGYTLA